MFQPSGSANTFREQGQQNTCQDVNIRLKRGVLYITWQFASLSPVTILDTNTNQKVKHNTGKLYLKAI
jgi:hypothetical protein